MQHDLVMPFARLRSALYSPSPMRKPGKCLVNQADLELLLAEVEALSNAQMARYLTKLVLEELRNGESTTEGTSKREAKRRTRRPAVLRGAHRAPADRRVAEVSGPFGVTEQGVTMPMEFA